MELNELHAPEEQASSLLKVLLGVFAGVLILALGFFVYQENRTSYDSNTTVKPSGSSSSNNSEATADETASWKTYTSEEYGFSFKYPENWAEKTGTAISMFEKSIIGVESPETTKAISEFTTANPRSSVSIFPDIVVSAYDSVSSMPGNPETLETAVQDTTNFNSYSSTTVAGRPAYKVVFIADRASYGIILSHNSKIVQILFPNRESESSLSDTEKEIINSISFVE